MAKDELWDVADVQHGFVTARQAADAGVAAPTLQMLVHRGTLQKVAHGVYRFPKYPVGSHDAKMLAVLWTGAQEAALSHETALDAYAISDVNPNRIHVTVARRRRIRRSGGDAYVIHYQDLQPAQVGWWNEIPMVTAAQAISQCIDYGTPIHLLRQAVERGHAHGYLTKAEQGELAKRLEMRHE
ncbi:type IV toxin-antitoxin system AbiEi family antitoxin domain-containing protein [Kocuria sp.]|uniref:type IV toxin-antitoxin system AbiEi family antitoxin domain-containing protein n=1 Tax=Kocuria sp. TaxID=1871328 RepID=UPI0026DF693B|nr:type IV toxin-antitoxin system AbiEi family antitoxin domain-containing protein [Kocuria sp.]MDO5617612.1 type IV toxin-antitoxin system AbiEi family antitoxin domain-containing protein [Kocuria sp.]